MLPAAVAFACSEARWPAPQVRHTWGWKQLGPRSRLLLFQLRYGGFLEAAVLAAGPLAPAPPAVGMGARLPPAAGFELVTAPPPRRGRDGAGAKDD